MVQLTIKHLTLNSRLGAPQWGIPFTCSSNSCTQEQLSTKGSEFWSESQAVTDFLQCKGALSWLDCQELRAQEGFSWKHPLSKELQYETLVSSLPCFSPELSPWNPSQQPCPGSVWDRPGGEGGWTSSVQGDCQPCTKSIQMISLANSPASKDPFRCPQKDNFC